MAYWLGVDCGGTWLKAGLYDRTGREHAIVRRPLTLISVQPGWAERDMSLLWQQCAKAIRDLLAQSATTGQAIRGVGISAQERDCFYWISTIGRWAMPSSLRIGAPRISCTAGSATGWRSNSTR
ncbi:L-xylulose/3-keto-L-gulonate kinase [Edwardsiella tarda]|nr:L-xylulose/3-keto-L-gulonate kinase [Edwardsiella tarda]